MVSLRRMKAKLEPGFKIYFLLKFVLTGYMKCKNWNENMYHKTVRIEMILLLNPNLTWQINSCCLGGRKIFWAIIFTNTFSFT